MSDKEFAIFLEQLSAGNMLETGDSLGKHLARVVHHRYFDPQYKEFAPRTMWSLTNAFTSAFKELDAIPQFRVTARLGPFLEGIHAA